MKRKLAILPLALLFCLLLPLPAAANAAEPPRLSVVVQNPPEDLELSLVFSWQGREEPVRADAYQVAWEGYYLFRPWGFPDFWAWSAPEGMETSLLVEAGGKSFSLPIDPQILSQGTGSYYNNLCVLDLQAQTLTPGVPWWRQPLLVCLRVGLTLLLEGLVFLFFGYRQRRSWLIFLGVNLVTQLGVNLLLLHMAGPFYNMRGGMGLLFWMVYLPAELLVLAVEIGAFRSLLREKSKGRATACAACANLLSWALGGAMLTYLPF